jgi:cytochrome bd-type quinol oxidase subunit 1
MEEALLLARVQFGLNIAFHILFPTITIGLAWLLVIFRLRYERTRDPAWHLPVRAEGYGLSSGTLQRIAVHNA